METSINNKCKAFTSLEQSKKLAEILPLESADMTYYACVKDWRGNPVEPKWGKPANLTKEELALPCSNFQEYEYVPCWSLASLLEILPKKLEIEDNVYELSVYFYGLYYWNINNGNPCFESKDKDNLVDACYRLILMLNELNLL